MVENKKSERVFLVLGDDRAIIEAARLASKSETQVIKVEEKVAVAKEEKKNSVSSTLLSLAMAAAALGVNAPLTLFRIRSSMKHCSRCQKRFDHPGAYCSKECFQASNSK